MSSLASAWYNNSYDYRIKINVYKDATKYHDDQIAIYNHTFATGETPSLEALLLVENDTDEVDFYHWYSNNNSTNLIDTVLIWKADVPASSLREYYLYYSKDDSIDPVDETTLDWFFTDFNDSYDFDTVWDTWGDDTNGIALSGGDMVVSTASRSKGFDADRYGEDQIHLMKFFYTGAAPTVYLQFNQDSGRGDPSNVINGRLNPAEGKIEADAGSSEKDFDWVANTSYYVNWSAIKDGAFYDLTMTMLNNNTISTSDNHIDNNESYFFHYYGNNPGQHMSYYCVNCWYNDTEILKTKDVTYYDEITQGYESNVIEGDSTTFSLYMENITYGSGNYSANLSWNGTDYTGTKTVSGNDINFTYALTVPNVPGDTSVNFYWSYQTEDETTTTTTLTQNISNVNITNCTGGGTVFAMFHYLNEETNVSLQNVSVEVTFETEDYGDFTFELTNVVNNTSFCFNPSTAVITTDMSMGYDRDDFGKRYYFLDDAILSNTVTNYYLFLLNESSSYNTTFTIEDQDGNYFEGARLSVMKSDAFSSYYTVAMGITDGDGQTKLAIDWNEYYKFNVVKEGITYLVNGKTLENQDAVIINTDEITVIIDTNDTIPSQDALHTTLGNCTTNDTANFTRCSWYVSTGVSMSGCLNVTRETWNLSTVVYSSCTDSSDGTISYTYTEPEYFYRWTFTVENSGGYMMRVVTGTWEGSISPDLDDWSLFLAFILILTLGFAGFMMGASEGIFATSVGLVFSGLIGLVAISIEWQIGIFLVGVIGAYVVRR
jgi:hypothetical protein